MSQVYDILFIIEKQKGLYTMGYQIVEITGKTFAGIGCKTTNENMQGVKDISLVWQKLFSGDYLQKLQYTPEKKLFGLYTNYEGDFSKPYSFYAGSEVDSAQNFGNGFTILKIPAGRYAKFSAIGEQMQVVQALWQEIWATPLDRSYQVDYELYHPYTKGKHQRIDIFIGIQ